MQPPTAFGDLLACYDAAGLILGLVAAEDFHALRLTCISARNAVDAKVCVVSARLLEVDIPCPCKNVLHAVKLGELSKPSCAFSLNPLPSWP